MVKQNNTYGWIYLFTLYFLQIKQSTIIRFAF